MARLLAELDRLDSGLVRRAPRAPGDRRRGAVVVVVGMLLAVAGGCMFAHEQFGVTLTADGLTIPSPLATPPSVDTGRGSFSFMATQRGSDRPVAYDPCEPVEYVVHDDLAPPGAEVLLTDAIEEISAATGLIFDYVGRADDVSRLAGPGGALESEPVLIAWTTPDVVEDLSGRIAGVAGSALRQNRYAGELEYITGTVALDAPQLAGMLDRPMGSQLVRAVIMHELGHLVGLGHVDDPRELMYEQNAGQVTLGPGDREGLAALGSGSCFS